MYDRVSDFAANLPNELTRLIDIFLQELLCVS